MVWSGVLKVLLPNGNSRDALHTGNAKREGCVSKHALLCVVYLWQGAVPLSGAGQLLSTPPNRPA